MAKVRPGDTEFGGGDGMIQKSNIDDGKLTNVEEVWAIYATNPGDPLAPDGSEIPDPNKVGKPPYDSGVGWNHG